MAHLTGREARVGRLVSGLALLVYLGTAGGSLTTTDAVVTFDVTRSLVDHGRLALSGNLLGMEAHRGRDGEYYSPFGIGQSIYNIPFYLAAKAISALGIRVGKSDSVPKAVVALGQTVVAAAVVWMTFRFTIALTANLQAATLGSLALAFGTILWPYARFGFNQPLACFTLLSAMYYAFVGTRFRNEKAVRISGLWLAASLLTRHEMLLGLFPIVGWLWVDGAQSRTESWRRLRRFAIGPALGVAIWLALNLWRFGNPFDAGYLRDPVPAFGSQLVAGVFALLCSPGASLFVYSPVTIFGLIGLVTLLKNDRRTALWLGGLVALFVVFYGTLGNWIGGRSYGSRYLVVVLPYFAIWWTAALRTATQRRRMAFIVLLVVGVITQIPGVLVDYAKVSQEAALTTGRLTTEQHQWEWAASPIVLNARALGTAWPNNVDYVLGRQRIPSVAVSSTEGDRFFSQQFSFSLDLWWLYLFYLGVLSRAALACVVAVFSIAVVSVGWRLWRALAIAPAAAVSTLRSN